jgi:hypothetical protein
LRQKLIQAYDYKISCRRIGFCQRAVFLTTGHAGDSANSLTLWYRQLATNWTSALPIGNGRLGAMIFGGVERERLQLNEDTLWAGGPYDPDNTNAFAVLPEVRRLIFAGQHDDAARIISEKMMAKPLGQMPYETVGNLFLTFPTNAPVTDYHRARISTPPSPASVTRRTEFILNARFFPARWIKSSSCG